MKYELECGAHVTAFRRRKITVYANNEHEAKQKAIIKFENDIKKNGTIIDVGGIFADGIFVDPE